MTDPHAPTRFRLAALPANAPTPFQLLGDKPLQASLRDSLDLLDLRKLRLEGELIPLGQRDWQLKAHLGATAVQACTITLDPVTTRVETDILRTFRHTYIHPTETESEMPEDDTLEPLPDYIDLIEVVTEALALALPDYPRAAGAELTALTAAPPGAEPLQEAQIKPFASLAALKKQIEDK